MDDKQHAQYQRVLDENVSMEVALDVAQRGFLEALTALDVYTKGLSPRERRRLAGVEALLEESLENISERMIHVAALRGREDPIAVKAVVAAQRHSSWRRSVYRAEALAEESC